MLNSQTVKLSPCWRNCVREFSCNLLSYIDFIQHSNQKITRESSETVFSGLQHGKPRANISVIKYLF